MDRMQAAPKLRILLSVWGSRGDMQPYVAAALGMMAAGHKVSIMSKPDLKAFVEANGVNFLRFDVPTEAATPEKQQDGDNNPFLRAKADAAKMFDEGVSFSYCMNNIATIFHSKTETVNERNAWLLQLLQLCSKAPDGTAAWDLVCVALPMDSMGLAVSLVSNTPCLLIELQQWDPMPTYWLGGHQPSEYSTPVEAKTAMDESLAGLCRGAAAKFPAPCDQLLATLGDPMNWYNDWRQNKLFPWAPAVCAVAPLIAETLYPTLVREGQLAFLGNLVLAEEKQTPESAEDAGFGTASDLAELQAFIDKDGAKRPIYMGWGSMMPFMSDTKRAILLVVEALQSSSQRAIVLAGYLKLSMELLKEAVAVNGDERGLVAYAEANVVFKEKVPHEWLLKRVACTVHHGGAGTLSAALRACVPTVVTPVHPADQFDHAHLVTALGVGRGLKHFTQNTSEELGAAILECVTSERIQLKAKEVGAMLQEQANGVVALVDYVEKFYAEQVATGKWQAAIDEVKRSAPMTPVQLI